MKVLLVPSHIVLRVGRGMHPLHFDWCSSTRHSTLMPEFLRKLTIVLGRMIYPILRESKGAPITGKLLFDYLKFSLCISFIFPPQILTGILWTLLVVVGLKICILFFWKFESLIAPDVGCIWSCLYVFFSDGDAE